ncbi:hypothetical protein LCGC14_1147800 [marine sediment metagenome]|uniref:HNH nuclease domain-containing protein n=1 Tax=marine sediment metagenome TaxID=412755 RepID=A0A0F9M1C7_9ZZZZ
MKKVSDKQKKIYAGWLDVKVRRIRYLIEKYEDSLCEYCGRHGKRHGGGLYMLDGHHIIKRSQGGSNNDDNCYICHRICHTKIHDQNIKVQQEDFQGFKKEMEL